MLTSLQFPNLTTRPPAPRIPKIPSMMPTMGPVESPSSSPSPPEPSDSPPEPSDSTDGAGVGVLPSMGVPAKTRPQNRHARQRHHQTAMVTPTLHSGQERERKKSRCVRVSWCAWELPSSAMSRYVGQRQVPRVRTRTNERVAWLFIGHKYKIEVMWFGALRKWSPSQTRVEELLRQARGPSQQNGGCVYDTPSQDIYSIPNGSSVDIKSAGRLYVHGWGDAAHDPRKDRHICVLNS